MKRQASFGTYGGGDDTLEDLWWREAKLGSGNSRMRAELEVRNDRVLSWSGIGFSVSSHRKTHLETAIEYVKT